MRKPHRDTRLGHAARPDLKFQDVVPVHALFTSLGVATFGVICIQARQHPPDVDAALTHVEVVDQMAVLRGVVRVR